MANNFPYIAGDGSSIILVSTNTSGSIHVPHLYAAGTIAHDAADSGNPIKMGGKASSSQPSAVGNGDRVDARFELTGEQYVMIEPTGQTSSKTISTADTTPTSVKASAGKLFGWVVWNTNSSERFLKFYDKASAPTVGTDTILITIPLMGDSVQSYTIESGITFGTGIAFGLSTGVADNDTGSVAANELVVNLFYT